jgi:prophage regulatory protein
MHSDNAFVERLLRDDEVRAITGLSRTVRWRLARQGKFPKPIAITNRLHGWKLSDIQRWIAERIAASEARQRGEDAR